MKRVLAVSDDPAFLASFREACQTQRGFQLVLASNAWEALAELRLRPASLAILDFNAETWDAYQLLAEIHQQHGGLEIIGLTHTPSVAVERRMKRAGAVRMLHRQTRPGALVEEALFMLHGSAKGHIEGLQLSSLLQVLDWERKDCLLRVQCHGTVGMLHFRRGYLVHAECREVEGLAAALEILAWEDARIDFLPPRDEARSIDLPVKELLLMAAQQRDEGERAV